jgi:hypothetical protein
MGLESHINALKSRQAVLDDLDKPCGLAEIARRIQRRYGRKPHTSTITRWLADGSRLRDGTRLKAKGDRLPGGWVTSERNIVEFIEALTSDRCGEHVPATCPEPAASVVSRTAERADAELTRLGI